MKSGVLTHLNKTIGQVYTPNYLVKNMLDFVGYFGSNILQKHIIDNSCGEGAFLCEIVRRYCEEHIKLHLPIDQLKLSLETYIHGIEIESVAYQNCKVNLDAIAKEFSVENVQWDIIHGDALAITQYNGRMNFVVGNPPYVRVHNLNDSYERVKNFSFANGGMTDLYLVFYELGLKMLSTDGLLCYITPSSWLSSIAGRNMRKYIMEHRNLLAIIDLEHFQPFDATAYTLISLFKKNAFIDNFEYYTYDNINNIYNHICSIPYSKAYIDDSFYLDTPEHLDELKKIKVIRGGRVCVKNGFATLADKVFIGEVPDSSITIPIIKASTGKWSKGLYPYDKNGKPIPRGILFSDSIIAHYFEDHKSQLLKGKKDNGEWFYYGRTQALKDVFKRKISINTIIKDVNSIKLNVVEPGCGVYSGLYILTDIPFNMIKTIICTEDFISYVKKLKKYKSGGYFTFNAKDLEQYIEKKLDEQ